MTLSLCYTEKAMKESNKDYICIVGGANMDISAYAYAPLIVRDSNPSRIKLSLGGVGRNVAENFARIEQNVAVELVTVIGNDTYSKDIRANCQQLGIGLNHCLYAQCNTSTYVCINDEKGEMFVGASDMEILDRLDGEFLEGELPFINGAKAVLIDTNLKKETLKYLFENVTAPIFVETVSANKTMKLIGLTAHALLIKPNLIEAEMLTGQRIGLNEADLVSASRNLVGQGYQSVVITLGEKGCFYFDGTKGEIVSAIPTAAVNTTGAGDSFMAALIWAYCQGKDLAYSVRAGNVAANITLRSVSTVSPDISADRIIEMLKSTKDGIETIC